VPYPHIYMFPIT